MTLSRETKLVAGITLILIPTIQYGGLTLLGILTGGVAGMLPGITLDETQWALWRAGHAHAGVWVVLSLAIQIMLDSTRLSAGWRWLARVAAPLSAVAVSAGFFGIAFAPGLRWLLYIGGALLFIATVISGVGLLRNLKPQQQT